jgi:signal transduction histidine kinase
MHWQDQPLLWPLIVAVVISIGLAILAWRLYRRRLLDRVHQARQRASEASRLQKELLANVSHDLLTPLNAILGYADMLRSDVYGPLSERQLQIMERIVASSKQLADLIYDLLDQARVEAGGLELRNVSFSPADLVRDVEATVGMQAQAKGLAFTTELADDVPALLSGDPQRLRQILVNLAGNAVKFTAEGTVHTRVYRSDATHWAFQVSDTGPGVPEEAHSRVFDPFWQVDGSPTREHDGVGLGLSLVKHLVSLMGGDIKLESRVGAGSTFTVILPLLLPSEEEEAWKSRSR